MMYPLVRELAADGIPVVVQSHILRRQRLGRLTPIEFETTMTKNLTLAT